MLARYSGSLGAGLFVTAALIYLMQLMIAGGDFEFTAGKPMRLLALVRVIEPPPSRERREPLKPVERTTVPPDSVLPTINPTIETPTPTGPGTIPLPEGLPRGRHDQQGLRDFWQGDRGLVLTARVQPIYPHAALTKGLEGQVIVELTVTESGAVRNPRVVESSHSLFERAALAAVAKFRYQPRVVDGTAVAVTGVRVVIAFELRN